MPGLSFIDTNIWIYAHLRKASDPRHTHALAFEHTVDVTERRASEASERALLHVAAT